MTASRLVSASAMVLLTVLLGACAGLEEQIKAFDRSIKAPRSPDAGDVGRGTIILAPSTQTGFGTYLSAAEPLHFVVSTDGRHYAERSCDTASCSDPGVSATIDDCERKAGSNCKVYARGRNVVWQP